MLSAPSHSGTKVRTVIYGLAAGITILAEVVFVSALPGTLLAWFSDSTGWIKLGDHKPRLPLIFGEYSMPPGIIVGAIAWADIQLTAASNRVIAM